MDQHNNHSDDVFPQVPGGSDQDKTSGETTRPVGKAAAGPRAVPVYMAPPAPAVQRKSSFFGRIGRYLLGMILVLSLLTNVYLAIIVHDQMHQQIYHEGDVAQTIALIDLQEMIDMNTARDFRGLLQRARRDDNVKGVILVVNSPGGQVAPSALMHEYVREFKEQTQKPIYACIEQLGASGAYWISAATDHIYGQTNAAIGSIGVIYVNFVIKDGLEEKLGINPVVIKSSRSPYKDRGSPFRMPEEEDIEEIREDLDTVHKRFVSVVQQGRNLAEEQAWAVADGEVYDGPEALERGLIDQVGFLSDAIDALAQEAGLDNPMVVRYLYPPTLQELLGAGAEQLSKPWNLQEVMEEFTRMPRIMALWPGW